MPPDEHNQDRQRDRTFLARYGATILRGGIATIPSALFRYQRELGLKPQQVWFIAAILAHKWDTSLPHPSLVKMEKETGVSRQTLHTYQRELMQAGWLAVINRTNSQGGQDTNFYDFTSLFAKLEDLLERERAERGSEGSTGVNPSSHPPVKQALHPSVNPALQHPESVTQEPERKNHYHPDPSSSPIPARRAKQGSDDDDLTKLMIAHGIGVPKARKLRALADPTVIREQLAVFDHLTAKPERNGIDPPGTGYLIRSIERPDAYPPPASYKRNLATAERRRQTEAELAGHQADAAERQLEELRAEALQRLSDPQQRARTLVETFDARPRKHKQQLPLTDTEYAFHLAERTRQVIEADEAFFQKHPELLTWAQTHLADQAASVDQPGNQPPTKNDAISPSPEPQGSSETEQVVRRDLRARKARQRPAERLTGHPLPFSARISPAHRPNAPN